MADFIKGLDNLSTIAISGSHFNDLTPFITIHSNRSPFMTLVKLNYIDLTLPN